MVKSTDAKNEADTSKGKAKADVKKSSTTKSAKNTSAEKKSTTKAKSTTAEKKSTTKVKSTTAEKKSTTKAKSSTKGKTSKKTEIVTAPECKTVYHGKQVLIVESPNKIQKIKSLLKKIGDHPNFQDCNFIVTASMGHIREIDKKRVGIDINDNFKPFYKVSDSKTHVVWDLKDLISDASIVWLAADADREGEAIAWHLKEVLKLTDAKYQRITFNEITEKALKEALLHPRKIDFDMFYSQQARSVIDKLIGYLISPVLDTEFKTFGLSAGRVQSVAVDLVVQREAEIEKFESHGYFQVKGTFKPDSEDKKLSNLLISSDLDKTFADQPQAQEFLDLGNKAVFKIIDISTTKTKRKPPPPLITSSLQQEASTKLGISPQDTMRIAQKLYENGLITYMRTDSVVLSDDAKKQIKNQIEKSFGDGYHKNTNYANKESSQEAHEACRPSDFSKKSIADQKGMTSREDRIYQLIWKRSMASQMAPAECEIKTVKIGMDNSDRIFIAKAEKITYRGFLALYQKASTPKTKKYQPSDDDEEGDQESLADDADLYDLLKQLEIGQVVLYQVLEGTEKFSKPPKGRFTEASLIKELERLKIGRPSTYASIITKIQDTKRGYVIKRDRKGEKKDVHILQYKGGKFNLKLSSITMGGAKQKLFPGHVGKSVTGFMRDNFKKIMDYDFTANVEKELDEIALGKFIWHQVVKDTYDQFNPQIEKLRKESKSDGQKGRIKRFLGVDGDADISIIYSKWGPSICRTKGDTKKYVQLSEEEEYDITLKEALELLKYPLIYKQGVVEYQLCKGSGNFYIKLVGKGSTTIEKEDEEEVFKMDFEGLRKYFSDHYKDPKASLRVIDKDICIRDGKYGPYVSYKDNKVIASIPKKMDYNTITRDQCAILINNKKAKMKKPNGKKAPAKSKPKAKTTKAKAKA